MKYFECTDSGNLYAVDAESRGIFQLYRDKRSTGPWVFLAPETEAWDAVHQKIYRNGRATEVEPGTAVPPVPPAPEGPFPSWAENLGKGRVLPAVRYPGVARWAGTRGVVYVVLEEDSYESMFGDGCFRYLSDVFVDRAEARRAAASAGKWQSMTVQSFTLKARDGYLYAPDFGPGLFEHYKLEEVLDKLEARLGK